MSEKTPAKRVSLLLRYATLAITLAVLLTAIMMSMTIVAKATPTSPTTVTQQQSSVGIQSSGSVKEIVGNYDMLFYVSDVKISNSTNSTTIEVLGIIKNLDLEPEAYTYSYGRLIDSQGRQYAVSYVTETANLAFPIPTNDTALVSIKFTIPPDAVSIANILSYQGLEVDISNTKSPGSKLRKLPSHFL